MHRNITRSLLSTSLLCALSATAQTVVLDEQFTGGASSTGFTIMSDETSDCAWVYAPQALGDTIFNQDNGGAVPAGAGFDGSFVFVDSDECFGTTANTVSTYLISPAFDASTGGEFHVVFDHQFRDYTESSASVDVYNGTAWTNVGSWVDNIGYPNPATTTDINITTAAGGSAVAQVRFHYEATWDWWWAIDNVRIINGSVGIAEHYAAQPLKVYPNPANTLLNVSYRGTNAVAITVMDATGRAVIERSMAKALAVDGLREGAYTLLLRDVAGNVVARTPFVKQ